MTKAMISACMITRSVSARPPSLRFCSLDTLIGLLSRQSWLSCRPVRIPCGARSRELGHQRNTSDINDSGAAAIVKLLAGLATNQLRPSNPPHWPAPHALVALALIRRNRGRQIRAGWPGELIPEGRQSLPAGQEAPNWVRREPSTGKRKPAGLPVGGLSLQPRSAVQEPPR